MGINSMSCSKILALIVWGGFSVSACASPSHSFQCPANITVGPDRHQLYSASVFNGPPSEMADLIPDFGKKAARWDLDYIDPYLVCKYKGTEKVITLHVTGAKRCIAVRRPFAAYCD